MSGASWDDMLATQKATETANAPGFEDGRLGREWVVPPFTILDTTGGLWRERRRAWLALGIESELGRGEGQAVRGALAGTASSLINYEGHTSWQKHGAYRKEADEHSNLTGAGALPAYADFGTTLVAPGTSIFDPVLAEVSYRWWCPPGGSVLDPFAGGSVRGIVAAMLGHAYTGVDLSAAQVAANREQAARIVPADKPMPRWYVGDSRDVIPDLPAGELFDMLFTCPPYYDLEVYSDDPRDLSAMGSYGEFVEAYTEIIAAACRRLRADRFATIVVSDVRDKDGFYVGLRRDTELAFERASRHLYNEGVLAGQPAADEIQDVVRKWDEAKLVNAVGTLAMRTMNQMLSSRKLGRQHQDVLVFVRTKPSTRDWQHEREAPPKPQAELGLLPPDPEPPVQVPLLDATLPLQAGEADLTEHDGGPSGDHGQRPAPIDLGAPYPAEQGLMGQPVLLPTPIETVTDWPATRETIVTLLEAATDEPAAPSEPAAGLEWAPEPSDGSPATERAVGSGAPIPVVATAPPPLGQWPNMPMGPTPGPQALDDMWEIRPVLEVADGQCARCGEQLTSGHAHERPFVTPEQAAALFEGGQWDRQWATPADKAAMEDAGLWPAE